MKKIIAAAVFVLLMNHGAKSQEKYSALNIGAGIGYFGPFNGAPALNLNYEFDVFRNFTLAPFIAYSTYKSYRYWGNTNYPYRDYYYRETIIPVGLKGSYYFDELFEAGPKWDFYLGASLGYAFITSSWENGYLGEKTTNSSLSHLFWNLHIGTEYHMTEKVGLFLDVSSGFSTIGLGFHF